MTRPTRATLALLLASAAAMSLIAPSRTQAQTQATPPAAAAAAAPGAVSAVRAEGVWDLTRIYPTDAAFQEEVTALKAEIEALARFKGTLGQSPEALLAALETMTDLGRRFSKAYSYASMSADEDLRNAPLQARRQALQAMAASFGEATAWFNPELLALGQERIGTFIAQNEGLKAYAFALEDILRRAPHTLTPEAERVMAGAGLLQSQPNTIYELLVTASVPWPTVTLSTGEEVRLDQSAYTRVRQVPNRADRKAVFDAFWGTWQAYRDATGAALNAHVQGTVFQARQRNYPNALAMELSDDNLPEAVYRQLVNSTRENLPALHRYLRLRAEILGITDMNYYDIYPPLVESETRYTADDSRQITLAAVRGPLGPVYAAALEEATSGPWNHLYPAEGKRPGAYMNGSVYDVHPYVLLNHHDDYDSLSTYAHEWGHGLHTIFTNQAQPFQYSDYSTFVAETAAIVNELLVNDHLLAQARTDEERLALLGETLEMMRGTFFRQASFSDFELAIHEAVERGEVLTGEKLTEMYGELLRRYYGVDEGVMAIDEIYYNEWAYIPHFYYNFYVYQYATSITASAWFVEKMGEPGMQEKYLNVLRAGGSAYPHDIFLTAGLDMTKPEAYEPLFRRMNRVMEQIEEIRARQRR